MVRPDFEIQDVIRRYADAYLAQHHGRVPPAKLRVLNALASCRTAALGGHVRECDRCEHTEIAYNSCRNRHCPKCQGGRRAAWLEARSKDLLDVEYFHVVFTIPQDLGAIALQNKKVVYDILLRASAQTLRDVAGDPRRLSANIGFLSVLHTWGQNLHHHPHVHCVVPGGGLSRDGTRWISCPRGFFLPVRVLGAVFKGKFLEQLKSAYRAGTLAFQGSLAHLERLGAFNTLVSAAYTSKWVVYAKRPFGGPQQVLKYLARYTHRVAVSNRRLVAIDDGDVTFSYKDYRRQGQRRHMTLPAAEFLRRFLQHVLPKGFVRIRGYGFLAGRNKADKLARCRELIHADRQDTQDTQPHCVTDANGVEPTNDHQCPNCGEGRLRLAETIPRPRRPPQPFP